MSTARIALPAPVASLQAIHREAEATSTVPCLTGAKTALVALTGRSVETLIQFMQKKELQGMVYQFLDRPKLIQAFEVAVGNATCEK